MNLDEISRLFRYNAWASDRIFAAAGKLAQGQFSEPLDLLAYDQPRSLRSVLTHMLGAEWIWRQRALLGVSPPSLPGEDEYPDLKTMYAHWREEAEEMRYGIAGLTSARLNDPITYTTTSGKTWTTPLGQILMHVVLHGMQHRAEVAMALTYLGASPGDLDFILFLHYEVE